MRKLLVLILMLSFLFAVSAAEDGSTATEKVLDAETFYILGYKVDPANYCKVIITDAISESLRTLKNGESIELTEHVSEITSQSTVIFSYRVAGITSNKVTISFSFSPLASESGKVITAEYVGKYFNLTKNSSADDPSMVFTSAEPTSITVDDRYLGNAQDSLPRLSRSWDSGTAEGEWISRGAIAMKIDPTSYEAADIGTYTADVYVGLTVV